jgi:hypothetical protein
VDSDVADSGHLRHTRKHSKSLSENVKRWKNTKNEILRLRKEKNKIKVELHRVKCGVLLAGNQLKSAPKTRHHSQRRT